MFLGWWVVKLARCSIDEHSSGISQGLIIWRVWIMLFSQLCQGGRARRARTRARERARRDVAWQWEVSDRILGAKAARLSANWVLQGLSWALIGRPPEGSSPSLADRTPLSLGHTAQFKTCCCRPPCESVNSSMYVCMCVRVWVCSVWARLLLAFHLIQSFFYTTVAPHTRTHTHRDTHQIKYKCPQVHPFSSFSQQCWQNCWINWSLYQQKTDKN